MISATFDTSVYIRALHFGGPAALLLWHAKAGTFRLDISDAIVDASIHDARQRLLSIGNRVAPTETLSVIKEDPDDDRILECAAAAESDYIVSEDKDLLRRGSYARGRIVTIRDFVSLALGRD